MKEMPPLKKSGMVVLVGRSNVGKSTLLNTVVGTKLAIITPKPQTTRHLIQGVVHDPRGQIVFVDTPGIFQHIPDRLTAKLNEKARDAVEGVDLVLYVVDPTRHVGEEEIAVHRLVKALKLPKFLVLNKSDMKRPFIDEYLAWRDEFDGVFEISALKTTGVKQLVNAIMDKLPEGEPLYPANRITDITNRFWIAEVIREKVFLGMEEEVPYTTAVEVEEIEERENGIVYVKANVLTNAARYKKMLIGQGARTIRGIGRAARKELEAVTGKKIFLDLNVVVEERWQDRFE